VDDADPQAAGMHLLAHQATASFFFARRFDSAWRFGFSAVSAGAGASVLAGAAARGARVWPAFGFWTSSIVMWHVRLLIRLTRPRARGRQRFSVGPSSA
jgi:hypothetical protein